VVGPAARAGLDGAQRCGRHPRTRSPSSQRACFGKRTATGPGSSAYTSRTALLTKRSAVRNTNTWLPSVHDGAVKGGLGVRREFPARRKPTALCPVDGPCFAWVPSARAGRHSREEESFLPVRPWSAVDPYLKSTPIQVKQHELGHHQFGRIDSIHADIARHRRADRGASKTWAQRRHPGARADGVLHQKERSQPTPVAMARCGNRHLGGGCCASSRSIP
jgi:hypothetical protein